MRNIRWRWDKHTEGDIMYMSAVCVVLCSCVMEGIQCGLSGWFLSIDRDSVQDTLSWVESSPHHHSPCPPPPRLTSSSSFLSTFPSLNLPLILDYTTPSALEDRSLPALLLSNQCTHTCTLFNRCNRRTASWATWTMKQGRQWRRWCETYHICSLLLIHWWWCVRHDSIVYCTVLYCVCSCAMPGYCLLLLQRMEIFLAFVSSPFIFSPSLLL